MNEHGHSACTSLPPNFQPTRRRPSHPPATPNQLQNPTPLATTAGRRRTPEENHHHHQHQKQEANPHPQLPSPPRPAGEAGKEEGARRRTFTTSPAPRPERGAEGKDLAQLTDAIASVFDAAGRHTHLGRRPMYTRHGHRSSPHLTVPRRRPEAEGSGGNADEKLEPSGRLRVAPLYCSRGHTRRPSPKHT